jgi:hypothetical protein
MVVLLGARLGWAAQTAAPTVDVSALAAFMEKWKTYELFKIPLAATDRPLTLAALAKDPNGPWVDYLSMQAAEAHFQLRNLEGPARRQSAAVTASYLKQGKAIVAECIRAGNTNASLRASRETLQQIIASFEGGRLGPSEIRSSARRMLRTAADSNSWDHGNKMMEANIVLGRAAAREGKWAEARAYLRAAGKAPSSPQLASYGPDLVFPRELLEHGAPEDGEAVLAFLEDISRYYTNPDTQEANARMVAADRLKEIKDWQQQIRDGKVPNHRKWR